MRRFSRRAVSAGVGSGSHSGSAESEAQRAREALEYKLRLLARETDPHKKREKAFRFLLSRGFSCDNCRAAIDEIDFNNNN